MAQVENKWVKKTIEKMKEHPELFWYIKNWGGGNFTRRGIPDLIICYKGRFIAIECKSGKNKPDSLQKINIELINYAGGKALTLWDEEILEFILLLIERG